MVDRNEDRKTSMSTAEERNLEQRQQGRQLAETAPRDLVPPVEIFEDGDAVYVVADMPGVSPENLNVEVANQMLEITGNITVEMPEGVAATFAEIRGSRYRRQFTLGRELDHDGIEATIRAGVLQVRLPKAESRRRRRIEIKAA